MFRHLFLDWREFPGRFSMNRTGGIAGIMYPAVRIIEEKTLKEIA
jgi:hypothetical protein